MTFIKYRFNNYNLLNEKEKIAIYFILNSCDNYLKYCSKKKVKQ